MDKKIAQVKEFVDVFSQKLKESSDLQILLTTLTNRTQPDGTVLLTLDYKTQFSIDAQVLVDEISSQKTEKDSELNNAVTNIQTATSAVSVAIKNG